MHRRAFNRRDMRAKFAKNYFTCRFLCNENAGSAADALIIGVPQLAQMGYQLRTQPFRSSPVKVPCQRARYERLVSSIGCGYGGRQMPDYQAYLIGEDGHIKQRIDLVCADDDAARERAESLVDGHAVELWCGERLMTRLERKQ